MDTTESVEGRKLVESRENQEEADTRSPFKTDMEIVGRQ